MQRHSTITVASSDTDIERLVNGFVYGRLP
jgi:hypothetical protein